MGCDTAFRACSLLANGPPRFQLGLGLSFKSKNSGICRGSIPPMDMSLYCFNRRCRKHVRDSHGPFPTIAQKNKPRTCGNPSGTCLRADFLGGASAAGSCCGCKKTPYLGQIARNLSFAAGGLLLEATGKNALFRQNKVFFFAVGVASWSLEVDISPHVGRGNNSSSPFQFAQTGPKSVCSLKWT